MIEKLSKYLRALFIFTIVSAFIMMLYGLHIKDYKGAKEMLEVIITTFLIWLGDILIDKWISKHQ